MYLSLDTPHNYFGKGGIMSEDTGGLLLFQKNIQNLYPKLLHPVHGIDKM